MALGGWPRADDVELSQRGGNMEVVANVTAAREVQEVGGIVEPIDRGYLARVTLGNRVLEREVLELFAGQLPVYVAQLRAADSQKDWRFAAHTIKGSALAVGANRLASLAHMAERLDLEAEPRSGAPAPSRRSTGSLPHRRRPAVTSRAYLPRPDIAPI